MISNQSIRVELVTASKWVYGNLDRCQYIIHLKKQTYLRRSQGRYFSHPSKLQKWQNWPVYIW